MVVNIVDTYLVFHVRRHHTSIKPETVYLRENMTQSHSLDTHVHTILSIVHLSVRSGTGV